MATNLVELFWDKTRGRPVARPGQGGGVGNIPVGGVFTFGYVHTQTLASMSWVVNHNFDEEHFTCQVYTGGAQKNFVLPDEIISVDGNTARIEFSTPQTGYAHFVFLRV